MLDPVEEARKHIKRIKVALDAESVEGSYDTTWGYLLALHDFDLIKESQKNDLDHEASDAKKTRNAELRKQKR